MHTTKLMSAVVATLLAAAVSGAPADPFADVEIKAQHVSGKVNMLEGAGGNIGVSVKLDAQNSGR